MEQYSLVKEREMKGRRNTSRSYPLVYDAMMQLDYLRLREHRQSPTVDYSRLTSFLNPDNSFFSPWSWDPTATGEAGSSSTTGDYEQTTANVFQPGSFFSYEVCNVEPEDSWAEEEEEAQESETTVTCDVEPEDSCGEEEEAKQSETTAKCDIVGPEDSCAEEEEEAKESETTVTCDVEPEDSCGEEEEAKQSETTAKCDIVGPEDSCAEEEEAKQ